MATDSTNLPQGELNFDADMNGGEEFGAVQLAQVTADAGQPVQLPAGQAVILVPVRPGQTLTLPTDNANGLLAKIGPEGNLAIVIDGRTIIFQGYVQANDQSPVRVVTTDGDVIDVADVVASTDPTLEIQTAAGPATGNTGDTAGSGIFTPFVPGDGPGLIGAEGVLNATALNYKLINNEFKEDVQDEDTGPSRIEITFDILGGVINEDDLPGEFIIERGEKASLIAQPGGNYGEGNDPFDSKDREEGGLDSDGDDGFPDADREPLQTVATVTVSFGDDVPGQLLVDPSTLPSLTSEGEQINYEHFAAGGGVGEMIVGYVDGPGGTDGKFDPLFDRVVFDVKVQEETSPSVFHVVFTLYDNIDNEAPDANNDGRADLLGANEQILDLPVKITAVDSDGTPLSAVLQLGVEDDIPFFGEVSIGEGSEGLQIVIEHTDASVTHDESWGQQGDADDQSIFDPTANGPAFDATQKITNAGFSLPYGDSPGALVGIAQKQVFVSFGADQASTEQSKDADDKDARNSIFGELEDRTDADGDGLDDGENERPFELFMIEQGKGSAPAEDNLSTAPNEGNLTISDQKTNAFVTFNGEILQVWVHQIDAQTIVGYVITEEGEQEQPQEARAFFDDEDTGKEAVFVLTINDDGVLTFVQYHQINHDVDGPSKADHDDSFHITGEDGTPIIHVRASDNDGDHATQPVDVVVQDDGPKFIKTFWGFDGDSTNPFNGTGLIDEDKLSPNGNNDNAPGDDKGGTHADGQVVFDFGVDQEGTVDVKALKITDSADNTILNISLSYIESLSGDRSYTIENIDPSLLRTADGEDVSLEATFDALTGLLTIVGKDEGGDPVFTLTMQTNGSGTGEFNFDLHQPLNHPWHDFDSDNVGPQTSYEDNLKFDVTVEGKDSDGDTAEGHIKIKVDDDSPKATCDIDCVTEGKTEGELNTASGNVVTGTSAFFADDSNGLDGNSDAPGADQPYTISKLVHGDDTYNLLDHGNGTFSVTKNGGQPLEAGESFDGKVLTIPTEHGGTFEMVLVSDNQNEVGDYKYTVPEDAEHEGHDKHAGPSDEAQSMSTDFDEVSEWTGSFAAAGITLVPTNGSLAIKSVNVSGPEYRGIGVGGAGDETETDINGPDQSLALQFAQPTDNAKLTIGALYDGVPDGGRQEILLWQVYNAADVLIASGQILGSSTGQVVLDIDTNGVDFSKIVLSPLENGGGNSGNNSDFLLVNAEVCCPTDKFKEEFDYTLRDADGDESTATLKIDVKDTAPTAPYPGSGSLEITVDEDGLNQPGTIRDGIGDVQPGDADEGDAGPDDGKVSGNIPFTPGADPVKIELSVGNNGNTGLFTVDGLPIHAAWDAEEHRLVGFIAGTDPDDPANQVFVMQITDEQSGGFTFTLLKPIEHPDYDGQENGDNENVPDPYVIVNVQIEDKDCDVAYTQVKVNIDDDMPVVDISANSAGTTQHDETAGRDQDSGDDDQSGPVPSLFNVLGAGPAIGWAHDGDSVVSINNARYGADGPGTAQYSLVVGPGGVDSGVDTTDGHSVWLYQGPNGIIVGREGSGADGSTPNPNGAIIFAVSIDNDGELTVVQYDSLKHPDNPNNFDEDIGLIDGSIQVKLTLTDADNDSASDTANIGQLVRFDDDGPKAKLHATGEYVQHDETAGVQNPGSGADRDQAGPLPAAFAGIVGTLIGWAKSDAAVVSTSGSSAGGDDEGATTSLKIEVSSSGVDSGIDDTATGQNILLYQNGDIIEGRVGGSGGAVAFAVSINPDGTLNVAQYRALEHPDQNDHDEDVAIKDSAIRAVYTITDGDGDKDVAKADIGNAVRFDDDGPTAHLTLNSGAQILLDESVGAQAPDGLPDGGGNPNDEAGNVAGDIAYAKVSGSLLFTDSSTFGQDGPGTKSYSLDVVGAGSSTKSGLQDAETNQDIYLVQIDADTVVGRVGSDKGTEAFRIDVNTSNGDVTVTQSRALEHNNAGSTAEDHDENTSPEIMDANKLILNVNVTDGDEDGDSDGIDLGLLIKFEDDGPIARDDVDNLASIGGGKYEASGNVITGANVTTPGVDDGGSDKVATISKIQFGGSSDTTFSSGVLEVNGTYGTLKMEADGDYTYDFNEAGWAGKVPSGSTEVFTYTYKDSDGDIDTATLTIVLGTATVETSATVNNGAGGCIPEDTYGPLTLTADPGAGDRVTQITLTNIPAGWDIKDDSNADFVVVGGTIAGTPTYDPVAHTITFNINGATPGVDVSVTVQVKGAPDSDVNGTGLVVGATVVDGVVFAQDTTPFNVSIDAVADGDDKGDDGDAAKLNVTIDVADGIDANDSFQAGEAGNVHITASFDDFKDGSEAHKLEVTAPTGFSFNLGNVGVLPAGVVLDPSSTTTKLVFIVDSTDASGPAGVGNLTLDIPVTYAGGAQGSVSGQFTAVVTTTETPTEAECNYDNNTDSKTATDTVPLASPPSAEISVGLTTEGHCIFEDQPATFLVSALTDAGAHLTSIVLTGLPTGWSYDFSGLNALGISVDLTGLALGEVTINFNAGSDYASYDGTFVATPPADSDVDFGTLNAQVNAANDVDPTLTATNNDSQYFETDAVADGVDNDAQSLGVSISVADSGDADNTFALGEKGQLTLNATFDDYKDGSEVHQVTITAPAGFSFTGVNSGLPLGVSIISNNGTTLILGVDSKDGDGNPGVGSIANLQFEVQNVSAAGNSTVNFSAEAKATEQNSVATNNDDNKECTDGNNVATANSQATATTQTDLVPIAYDDKVSGNEPAPRNVNVLLILDRSGSMGDVIPNSGGKTRLQLLQEATASMLNTLAQNGDVRVMVIGFTTNAAEGSAGQWVDVATAIASINALTPDSLTNYEDALEEGAQAFNTDTGDRGDFADHDNLVFFMSDGVPTTGGGTDNHLTDANKQAWDNFLENPANSIDQLTVVGIGQDIASNDGDLNDVADPDYPGDTDSKNPFGQVIIVENENDLKDALGVAVATSKISGDVLDGSIELDPDAPLPNTPDFPGDSPAHVSFFQYDHPSLNGLDITITWDGVGAPVVVGGDDDSISGTKVSFDTEFGRMTFDMATGKFDFLAGPISGGDKTEHFTYKITDTDGDQSNTASLDVTINDVYVDHTPVAYDNHDAVTESSATGAINVLTNFNGSNVGGTSFGTVTNSGTQLVVSSGGDDEESYADLRDDLVAQGLSGAALDGLSGNNPQEGSAYVRSFAIATPSVLRFEYDYSGNSDGNDRAMYFVVDAGNNVVAQGLLGVGSPDSFDTTVNVPLASAGNYKVIFVTLDGNGSSSGESTLSVDFLETQAATINTVSGNVITNPNDTPSGSSDPAGAVDQLGDGTNRVSQVQFGATIVTVPGDGSFVTIQGANGILKINSTGAYTYTSIPGTVNAGAVETDAFTYTLRDTDGDTDTAILRLDSTGVGGTITISDVTVNEGGTANVTVTLSEPAPAGGLLLQYAFGGGTATLGGDYNGSAPGATVFIAAGATTANIQVNAKTDTAFDDNETYNVVIGGAPAGWTIIDDTGVVTINDTTTVTAPVVSFSTQNPSGFLTAGESSNTDNPWTGSDSTSSGNRDNVGLGTGNDVGNARAGHDHVDGGSGNDTLSGGAGNDYLEGGDGNDTLNGGDDSDLLEGGNNVDTLHGDAGNDRVDGGNDADQIFGDDGNDELFGGDGADTVNGGNNNDFLHGGTTGNNDDGDLDKFFGGAGDDWIDVDTADLGAGRQIDGGTGNDVLDISGSDLTGSTGITGIEVINMEGAGNQDDVTLSASDVLNIAGGNMLFIWGDGSGGADDDVSLTGGTWSQVGDNLASNGRTYDIFQATNGALVAVDTDVEVALS
jgi:Mg-chelatase subunit ChlD